MPKIPPVLPVVPVHSEAGYWHMAVVVAGKAIMVALAVVAVVVALLALGGRAAKAMHPVLVVAQHTAAAHRLMHWRVLVLPGTEIMPNGVVAEAVLALPLP